MALLDLLTATGDFKSVSRRNRAPESIGPDAVARAVPVRDRRDLLRLFAVHAAEALPARSGVLLQRRRQRPQRDADDRRSTTRSTRSTRSDAPSIRRRAASRSAASSTRSRARRRVRRQSRRPRRQGGRHHPDGHRSPLTKGQAMYIFGSGVITATINNRLAHPRPRSTSGSRKRSASTRVYTTKTLYGQYRRPVAIGAGEIKATGKIKAARFSRVDHGRAALRQAGQPPAR